MKKDALRSGRPAARQSCQEVPAALQQSTDVFESWLLACGAPQATFHRCTCGCRFRWPAKARRIETRVEGAVVEAVELAYCPACKSVCPRVLPKPSLNDDLLSDLDGAPAASPKHPESQTRIRAGVEREPAEQCIVASPRRHG